MAGNSRSPQEEAVRFAVAGTTSPRFEALLERLPSMATSEVLSLIIGPGELLDRLLPEDDDPLCERDDKGHVERLLIRAAFALADEIDERIPPRRV